MSTRHMKKMCTILLIISVMIGTGVVTARAENIDPDNDNSQYAYGENVGWLNFEPNGNGGDGAEVTDSQVTGYVWAENIGWINLSPSSYGGVANDGAGNLSGYAWGENVGWINFAPTGGGVTIGTDGVFDGWAWGENIGGIHLKNLAIPYKVKTAWAPLSTTPTPTPTPSPTLTLTPTPTVVGTGTIYGWVEDVDEEPLEGVKVAMNIDGKDNHITETEEDGYYEFSGLAKGNYTLTFEGDGYQTLTKKVSLEEGGEEEVSVTLEEEGALGSISGYVVDIKDNPIESVKLRLKGPNAVNVKKAITDADGYFEFADLEAGTYVINATNKGYKGVKKTITLEEGEDREMEIMMKKIGKGK